VEISQSDRIAVISKGRIMGVVACEDATLEQPGLLMTGVRVDHKAQAA